MPRQQTFHIRQHGVAIITALLIMAIVATISITLARHVQMDVRRTGNIIANEQALMFITGAEEFAKYGLKLDRQNNATDNDYELRAQPRTFPFVGGTLTGIIKGQQGCFNINNLYTGNTALDALAKQRFQLLLSTLKLNPGLADAVIDWIDPDLNTTLPDGAEDGYYTNLPTPYRTSNQPMQSLSELRLVKGFNAVPSNNTGTAAAQGTVYDIISPFLCAFGVPASINVNTAPAEVLRSLSPNLTQIQADAIVANIKNLKDPATGEVVGYSSVTDMINLNKLSTVITNTTGLSVTTDYFLLVSNVITSQSRVQMFSLLYRDPNSGETSVLRHSIGAY
jgi:general secretion pathway protein K